MKKNSLITLLILLSATVITSAQQTDTSAFKLTHQLLPYPNKPLLDYPAPLTTSSSVMHKKFDYLKAYHESLGFFCKAENKASKNAPVQLRMRLGSLEYVDRLEGKVR